MEPTALKRFIMLIHRYRSVRLSQLNTEKIKVNSFWLSTILQI